MKRALLVGINEYDDFTELHGCVNDVNALLPLLARNEDDSPNFHCQTRLSSKERIERRDLREAVDAVLAPGADVALFYFAGHGHPTADDVVLVTQDGSSSDYGVPVSEILGKVRSADVNEVIIILDCCFSGAGGRVPQIGGNTVSVRDGISILSASQGNQPAVESFDRGLFSTYLCGALEGGAADVLGKITVASLYAYFSESFGPWDQRPTFKANINRLHEIRLCAPAVPFRDLRRLPEFFPKADGDYLLDPSFEPTAEPRNPENEAIFSILQKCRAAKLLEPVGAEHMYFAAMRSTACRLTPLGGYIGEWLTKIEYEGWHLRTPKAPTAGSPFWQNGDGENPKAVD